MADRGSKFAIEVVGAERSLDQALELFTGGLSARLLLLGFPVRVELSFAYLPIGGGQRVPHELKILTRASSMATGREARLWVGRVVDLEALRCAVDPTQAARDCADDMAIDLRESLR